MAQAARRINRADGPDIVRRLLARPIRLEQDRRDGPPTGPRATLNGGRIDDEAPDAELDAADELDRVEAELTLVKAVLLAERRDADALRARLDRIAESGTLDTDAEAVRARWARLVDTLLRAPH